MNTTTENSNVKSKPNKSLLIGVIIVAIIASIVIMNNTNKECDCTQDVATTPDTPVTNTPTVSNKYQDGVRIIGYQTTDNIHPVERGSILLCHAETAEEEEIFGVFIHRVDIPPHASIRVGIGHIATAATVKTDDTKNVALVKIAIDKNIIEDIRSRDAVQVRIEGSQDNGAYLGRSDLLFYPESPELNQKEMNKKQQNCPEPEETNKDGGIG